MTPMLWGLLACGGGTTSADEGGPPLDTSTTDTDTDTDVTVVDTGPEITPVVSCVPHATNVLRFDCAVLLDDPVAIDVVVERDGQVRTFESDGRADPVVPIWFMRPQSNYQVRALLDDGTELGSTTVVTGQLPSTLDLGATITGATSVDAFLFAPSCPAGWVVLMDPDGEVLWYQQVATKVIGAPLTALQFTEDDTLLVSVGRFAIIEMDWQGQVLLELEKGVHFDRWVHHDLFRRDGITYALRADTFDLQGETWILDGVYAFDSVGLIDEFGIEDAGFPLVSTPFDTVGYWAAAFPNAHDYSHANAIHVGEDGDILVSFRHLHTVARFSGGPGTPEFGTVEWLATGRSDSPLWPGDLVPGAGTDPGFGGQHHVSWGPDGSLWMMDNGFDFDETARGVRYSVDEVAGTLDVVDSWETERVCSVQSSAFPLDDDRALLTCGTGGWVGEFLPGEPDPVWELQLSCGGPIPLLVPRVIPLTLPDRYPAR